MEEKEGIMQQPQKKSALRVLDYVAEGDVRFEKFKEDFDFLAEAEKRGVRPANFSVGAMNAVIDFLCMNYPEEYQLRSRP